MHIMLALLANSAPAADLVVNGETIELSGELQYDNLRVTNGGTIVVAPYDGSAGGRLTITATSIIVDATSRITADGAGYRGGTNDNNGEGPGGGLGQPGNDGGGGGGHGGPGGQGLDDVGGGCDDWEGTGGVAYDNTFPATSVDMGSGGAAGDANGSGGAGGGAVILISPSIEIGGTITANGANGLSGPNDGGGAGAGGGILLVGDSLSCTGTLSASGGDGTTPNNGTDGGGGGGGGVIHQYFHTKGQRCSEDVSSGVNRCGQSRGATAGTSTYEDPGGDFFDWDLDGYLADDCAESDAAVNPGATEVCDGIDNNCVDGADEATAEDAATTYADSDSDGFGDPDASHIGCTSPNGNVENDLDCDDDDAATSPDGDEVCGGGDEDCDGQVDDNDDSVTGTSTFYGDTDGDGFGDPNTAQSACDQPTDTSDDDTDCDDTNGSINPAADEVCGGGDENCDGQVDEAGATGALPAYPDDDGDNFGRTEDAVDSCGIPDGYSSVAGDCDDDASEAFPGAPERCNGNDDDCNAVIDDNPIDPSDWFTDSDGDGYGDPSTVEVSCGDGDQVDNGEDCDDSSPLRRPGAAEQCNGLDDDCDGVIDNDVVDVDWWEDADGDGYGEAGSEPVEDCAAPDGFTDNADDCDDGRDDVNPGAEEVCGPADDDCDGDVDEDLACDTGGPIDTGEPPDTAALPSESDRAQPVAVNEDGTAGPAGCGCQGSPSPSGPWPLALLAGLLLTRRRR